MKQIFLSLIGLVLFSCTSSFYQVYKVEPDQANIDSLHLVFEDQNVKTFYSFWARGGDPGFTIFNKTDQNLVLNLDSTFFVLNGVAYDYFKKRTISKSNMAASSFAYQTYPAYFYRAQKRRESVATSNEMAYEEQSKIVIPPQSGKAISEYNITSTVFKNCDLPEKPDRKNRKVLSFTKATSPMVFQNVINYSIAGKTTVMKNSFFVKELANYHLADVMKKKFVTRCGKRSLFSIEVNKEAAPNKFYNTYSDLPEGN